MILEGLDPRRRRELVRASMRVYAVTDGRWLAGRSLVDVVDQAIWGGATFVQLREKDASHERRVELARQIAPVCARAGVPFVIDDDVECALQVGADGVHVGQSDEPCSRARALLGPDAIVGVSVGTVEQALQAQRSGADYLGVGAIWATATKTDAEVPGIEGLRRICAAVDVPCVAIGGIKRDNVGRLAGTGVDGVAVVSEIFAAADPLAAARGLLGACERAGVGSAAALGGPGGAGDADAVGGGRSR